MRFSPSVGDREASYGQELMAKEREMGRVVGAYQTIQLIFAGPNRGGLHQGFNFCTFVRPVVCSFVRLR